MNGLDDEQFQKLLRFTLPEENFQAQSPQLQQGLLEQRRAQTYAANRQQQRAGSLQLRNFGNIDSARTANKKANGKKFWRKWNQ